MRKFLLFFFSIFVLTVMAEKTIYLHKTDGTKETYLASAVDSIGFVNVHTITFNANGGTGSMDVLCVKEGESIALPVNGFSYTDVAFAGWNTKTDGSGTSYADKATVKPTANITLYAQWETPKDTGIADGHEWVDLGLPSGTKWATCNLGADSPEDYGDYFAWGETTPKSTYSWNTYKWCNGSETDLTKYCTDSDYGNVDNKTTLDLSDDAAYVIWGNSWRMPTDAEQDELRNTNFTTWTWTTQNRVRGYKVTSKTNGNSIFLPAAGIPNNSGMGIAGAYAAYWSSSLRTNDSRQAYELDFNSDIVGKNPSSDRRYGQSVRPVLADVHTITFNANGGTGSMDVIRVKEGESIALPANEFSYTDVEFAGWNTAANGSGTAYANKATVKPTANMTLYAQWVNATTGIENGHEWVDLGLPSGTKWATCNVGADSPEDYGDYFTWGETTPKSSYTSSNYNYSSNPTTLPLDRDAAYTNWGSSWRMPTRAEQYELINPSYTTWTWTTQNGVEGYKVTSKTNGNSIFLPAAGERYDSDLNYAGSGGFYWSSSLFTYDYSGNVWYLDFFSSDVGCGRSNRYFGRSVRPVLAE